jgi:uncharacterized protein (TIGR03435 family)
MRILLISVLFPVLFGALAPAQAFEVATVKLSQPPQGNLINIDLGTFRDGTLFLTNVTLNDLLKYAYELVSDEQLSTPEWAKKDVRFDIVAKASPSTPPDELHRMTRTLLTDRLHVVLRREQKVLPHLALIVGKSSVKVLPSTQSQLQAPQVRGRIHHNQMPMSLLVSLLSRFERQTIVDLTGLQGFFEVKLEWAPDNSLTPAPTDAAPTDRPNLFEAVREQLGLKLESRRSPLEVLIVEKADQVPEAN